MEDLESFWIFQESIAVDELKQKLQYTTYELELTRKETDEEIRKSNEQIKKLCQLIQTTCKERDEAKAQLKKFQQIMFFNNKKPPNNVVNDHIIPTTGPFSPDSPLLTTNYPTKTNSTITESTSFSLETHTKTNNSNNNVDNFSKSHVSSPVVDYLSSPDSSNVVNFSTPLVGKPATLDQESLIIANLAKGRSLPTEGKLLQAVIEAGPLLSTLMVAGSLPQWRNPPGVLTHQIPPVNLKGCVGTNTVSNSSADHGPSVGVISHNNKQIVMPSISSSTMYNGHVSSSSRPIGICQNSMLDFGSGSCFMGVSFDYQIPKRQRII